MKTESITTHEIRVGDVILNHGMRLVVDQEPQVSKAHPVNEYSPTLWTRALIENWDEVEREADSGHSTYAFIRGLVRDDIQSGRIRRPRWTIQGNQLARWARVISEV